MGLVDYGSDSDSDSAPPAASKPGLKLPPPQSASHPAAAPRPTPPATAAATATDTAPAPARKQQKDKGPRRIVLDLPAVQNTGDDGESTAGPAAKRPRIALGDQTGKSVPLTGLAAMLPKPKNEVPPPKPKPTATPAATAGPSRLDVLLAGRLDKDSEQSAPKETAPGPAPASLLPPSLAAKAKRKAAASQPAPPPAVDFFGISSVASSSSAAPTASSSRASLAVSSAPSFSAAPSVNDKTSASAPAAAAARTASDPYPGFTQLPSGEWVAKDQQTYEMWMAWQQQQQQLRGGSGSATPEGPDEKDVEKAGGMVDVDEAQRAREAWAKRPDLVPGKEDGHKPAAAVKGIPSQLSGSAKRKHQLSSLLAAAHDNRAELEERIAQARTNRKSGGNKYGF